jgi:hypothetical protein
MDYIHRKEKYVEIENSCLILNFDKGYEDRFELSLSESVGFLKWKGKFDLLRLINENNKWVAFTSNKRLSYCIEKIIENKQFDLQREGEHFIFKFSCTSKILDEEEQLEFSLLLKRTEMKDFEEKFSLINKNMLMLEKSVLELREDLQTTIQSLKATQEEQFVIFFNSLSSVEDKLSKFIMKKDYGLEISRLKKQIFTKYCKKQQIFHLDKKFNEINTKNELAVTQVKDIINKLNNEINAKLLYLETKKEKILQTKRIMKGRINNKCCLKKEKKFIEISKPSENNFEIVKAKISEVNNKESEIFNEGCFVNNVKSEIRFIHPDNSYFILDKFNKTIEKKGGGAFDYMGVRVDYKIPSKGKFSCKLKIEQTKYKFICFGIGPNTLNGDKGYTREKAYMFSLYSGHLFYESKIKNFNKNPNLKIGDIVTIDVDLDQETISLYNNGKECGINNMYKLMDSNISFYVDLLHNGDIVSLID